MRKVIIVFLLIFALVGCADKETKDLEQETKNKQFMQLIIEINNYVEKRYKNILASKHGKSSYEENLEMNVKKNLERMDKDVVVYFINETQKELEIVKGMNNREFLLYYKYKYESSDED